MVNELKIIENVMTFNFKLSNPLKITKKSIEMDKIWALSKNGHLNLR